MSMSRVSEPKSKRLVSKSLYVLLLGKRAALELSSSGLKLLGVLCGISALAFGADGLYFLLQSCGESVRIDHPFMFNFACLAASPFLVALSGYGFYSLLQAGQAAHEKAAMEEVLPFSTSIINQFPICDTLVRPVESRLIDSPTELLRAVTYSTETPPEQLVRPAVAYVSLGNQSDESTAEEIRSTVL